MGQDLLILRYLDHTQRRTTFGRTPLDEWSARRKELYLTSHNTHNRPLPDITQHSQQTSTWQHTTLTTDLYLTTHNTHNRQTPISPASFEPTMSVAVRPQTYAFERAATGIDSVRLWRYQNPKWPHRRQSGPRVWQAWYLVLNTARDRTVPYMCFGVGKKVGKSLIILVFFGCYAVSTGKYLPTFRRIVEESLSFNCVTLKMKAQRSL